ncbi:MAG: hypothetical protein JXA78_16765 [Anaerolineales bacterium]|nr:hypothetical protein [Anaerolineales bacterium]
MSRLSSDPLGYGPQYSNDPPFTARMRFHQSWYRALVLKVPCGVGPRRGSKTLYGNMLKEVDGQRGLNFLTPHIFQIARRRLAQRKGAVEPFRLLCNLLSSQPMCFNLFGPLVDDLELATCLIQSALPGEVKAVTKVLLEFAPEPPGEYLNDRTAFDVYIAYVRTDGSLAFAGVETKLTEPFSGKIYANSHYWKWTRRVDSPWPADVWPRLSDVQINQLWRDHLLAVAMRHAARDGFTSGRLILVYQSHDQECVQALETYKTLLKAEDETFLALPLDRLVETWQAAVSRHLDQEWLANFKLRYLDLESSQAAFEATLRSMSGNGC